MASNTILLKCDGHEEEAPAVGICKPGHLLMRSTTGGFKVHNRAGGRARSLFATESALNGKTINDAYAVDDLVFAVEARPGDVIQARLKIGYSVVEGDSLISGGDGSLILGRSALDGPLYEQVAASAAVTNTVTETAFDKSFAIPANTLKAGDVLHVRAQGIATATNSTDTLNVKLRLGGTTIVATGALDVANNDIFFVDALIEIRTIGASGTMVASGVVSIGVPGTATSKPFALASTALDTTAALTVDVTATWSVANAGNSVRMDNLIVDLVGAATSTGGNQDHVIAYCEDTVDNSAGSAEAFVRVRVA